VAGSVDRQAEMQRLVTEWMSRVGLTADTLDEAAMDPEIRDVLDRIEKTVASRAQPTPSMSPAPGPEMPAPVMPTTPQAMPAPGTSMPLPQATPLDPNQIPRTRREAEQVLREVAPSLSATDKRQLLQMWEQRYGV